jgi:hypothetical protein
MGLLDPGHGPGEGNQEQLRVIPGERGPERRHPDGSGRGRRLLLLGVLAVPGLADAGFQRSSISAIAALHLIGRIADENK